MATFSGSAVSDFEYPVVKRAGTNWTLSKQELRGKVKHTAIHQTNRTDDIEGSQPCSTPEFRVMRVAHNKPSYSLDTKDVEGASPHRLIKQNVQKDNNRIYDNRDIEHSYPESKLFSTPRVVNPLNPVYALPRSVAKPPTPPPQKAQTNKVDDIPGTHSAPKVFQRVHPINPLDYSDVAGSTAASVSAAAKKRQTPSMALETRDINYGNRPSGTIGSRQTNPLEPKYDIHAPKGVDKKQWQESGPIGNVEGSKPKPLKPQRTSTSMMYSLSTTDIEGASPGTSLPYPKERREWKKTCDVSDISMPPKSRRTPTSMH